MSTTSPENQAPSLPGQAPSATNQIPNASIQAFHSPIQGTSIQYDALDDPEQTPIVPDQDFFSSLFYDAPEQALNTPTQVSLPLEQASDTPKEVSSALKEMSDAPKEMSDAPNEVSNAPEEVADAPKEVSDTSEQASNVSKQVSGTSRQASKVSKQASNVPKQEPTAPTKATSYSTRYDDEYFAGEPQDVQSVSIRFNADKAHLASWSRKTNLNREPERVKVYYARAMVWFCGARPPFPVLLTANYDFTKGKQPVPFQVIDESGVSVITQSLEGIQDMGETLCYQLMDDGISWRYVYAQREKPKSKVPNGPDVPYGLIMPEQSKVEDPLFGVQPRQAYKTQDQKTHQPRWHIQLPATVYTDPAKRFKYPFRLFSENDARALRRQWTNAAVFSPMQQYLRELPEDSHEGEGYRVDIKLDAEKAPQPLIDMFYTLQCVLPGLLLLVVEVEGRRFARGLPPREWVEEHSLQLTWIFDKEGYEGLKAAAREQMVGTEREFWF